MSRPTSRVRPLQCKRPRRAIWAGRCTGTGRLLDPKNAIPRARAPQETPLAWKVTAEEGEGKRHQEPHSVADDRSDPEALLADLAAAEAATASLGPCAAPRRRCPDRA